MTPSVPGCDSSPHSAPDWTVGSGMRARAALRAWAAAAAESAAAVRTAGRVARSIAVSGSWSTSASSAPVGIGGAPSQAIARASSASPTRAASRAAAAVCRARAASWAACSCSSSEMSPARSRAAASRATESASAACARTSDSASARGAGAVERAPHVAQQPGHGERRVGQRARDAGLRGRAVAAAPEQPVERLVHQQVVARSGFAVAVRDGGIRDGARHAEGRRAPRRRPPRPRRRATRVPRVLERLRQGDRVRRRLDQESDSHQNHRRAAFALTRRAPGRAGRWRDTAGSCTAGVRRAKASEGHHGPGACGIPEDHDPGGLRIGLSALRDPDPVDLRPRFVNLPEDQLGRLNIDDRQRMPVGHQPIHIGDVPVFGADPP